MKKQMVHPTHFANILLTDDHPMGRMHGPTRKKGNWYHSISVFANTSIADLPLNKQISCTVIHFYGRRGGPVLETFVTKIRCYKEHMGKKLYNVTAWKESVGVIGDIRTLDGYHSGNGECNTPIKKIVTDAFSKWGSDKIPYTHQREESYNCVAFVDDILEWASKGHWNDRIIARQEKHGLY